LIGQTRFFGRFGAEPDSLGHPGLHLVGFAHAAQAELEDVKPKTVWFLHDNMYYVMLNCLQVVCT
jgi:hypothetical protein